MITTLTTRHAAPAHNSAAKAGTNAMPKKPPDTSTAANGALTRVDDLHRTAG